MNFVGFSNYAAVLRSENFGIAIKNSLLWVFFCVLLNSTIPLFLALLMNREFKGKQFFFAAFLIPWVTPVVGFAMMNKWLLEPTVGVVNRLLMGLGLVDTGINFLGRTDLALPTLILLNFWQFAPFGVLLLSAALSVIPVEQYDAMKVDGATRGQILKYLIMPYTGAMIGFLTFLGVVWTFNNYALIYLLTKGGPSGSTYTVPVMIFEKAFTEFNIGHSTALASMVGLMIILLGIVYFRLSYKSE